MQDLKEAMESVKYWTKGKPSMGLVSLPVCEVKILADLAQLFLEVKGMPEKKEYLNPETIYFPTPLDWEIHRKLVDTFNEALDLCKIAHMKAMEESRLTEDEIYEVVLKWYQQYCNTARLKPLTHMLYQAAHHKASLERGKG